MAIASISNLLPFFFFIFSLTTAHNNDHFHPLDPLTLSELNQVQTILKNSNPRPAHNLTFHYVGLDEPDKPTILSWISSDRPDKSPPRRAVVVARINYLTHEIIIDITKSSIISDTIYNGHGYPLLNFQEQIDASLLPLNYPPFLASITKRGLKVEEVICLCFTIGWYGEKKRTSRVVKVMCYYAEGTINLYMRPIEGVTVTVDLDTMMITGFLDRLIVPVPNGNGTEYRESEQKPPFGPSLKGVTILQPDGPSFTIEGHIIKYVNTSIDFLLNFYISCMCRHNVLSLYILCLT